MYLSTLSDTQKCARVILEMRNVLMKDDCFKGKLRILLTIFNLLSTYNSMQDCLILLVLQLERDKNGSKSKKQI